MLDNRYTYDGDRFDILGRLLPPRERSTSFEAEQVYHSDLLNQDFTSAPALAHAERLELMRRSTPSEAELALEAMPRDEWEPLLRAGAAREFAVETAPTRTEAGDTFVLAHPEMIDNRRNATKILKELTNAGKHLNPTVIDMESAYQTLRARGEIELNKTVLEKQRQVRIQADAQRHREEMTFDAEAAEKMPLDELYRRGGGGGRW